VGRTGIEPVTLGLKGIQGHAADSYPVCQMPANEAVVPVSARSFFCPLLPDYGRCVGRSVGRHETLRRSLTAMQVYSRGPKAQAAIRRDYSRVLSVTETVTYIGAHYHSGIPHLISERSVRRYLSMGHCRARAPQGGPGHHRGRPARDLDLDAGKDEGLVIGAELALHGNAHRMRGLGEVLLQKPSTMAELAAAIGVSVDDAKHIFARLRKNGLPVTIVEDPDPEPRYRILCPKGLVCASPGCGTLLSRSNPSGRCEAHGGGAVVAFLTGSSVRVGVVPETVAGRLEGGRLRCRGTQVHKRAAPPAPLRAQTRRPFSSLGENPAEPPDSGAAVCRRTGRRRRFSRT
jgi:hypothetical protein